MSIPFLFRCPISLDLFTDPVTLTTGQTYDRPSIEKWLAGGNSTCPVTMQRLPDFSAVPNHTLRQYVNRWLLRGVADHRNSQQGSGIPISLTILKTGLLSSETPLAAKLEALRKVRVLSTESDVGKSFLIQLDFFPVLVHLVFQCPLEM
ncbi:U-box domain-containing protein 26 [Dendrobium catenatum]|uniref:U-box domain-containing protein n=1 Tax=Dendrobium catenatum TaxID=906689 RepID=A0A2I0W6G7_9ASPA|nr:U-box domain-containing protein 26 [Dendrobium catenatum]